jgi:hypothetical protein
MSASRGPTRSAQALAKSAARLLVCLTDELLIHFSFTFLHAVQESRNDLQRLERTANHVPRTIHLRLRCAKAWGHRRDYWSRPLARRRRQTESTRAQARPSRHLCPSSLATHLSYAHSQEFERPRGLGWMQRRTAKGSPARARGGTQALRSRCEISCVPHVGIRPPVPCTFPCSMHSMHRIISLRIDKSAPGAVYAWLASDTYGVVGHGLKGREKVESKGGRERRGGKMRPHGVHEAMRL